MGSLKPNDEDFDYTLAPQISLTDVKALWISDYYDGYLSGFGLWEDSFVYFNIATQNNGPGWYRRFYVTLVPSDVEKTVRKNHDLFKEYVGGHQECIDGDPSNITCAPLKDEESWYLYYETKDEMIKLLDQLDNNEIKAWFED